MLASRCSDFAKQFTLSTGMLMAGVKGACADVMSQVALQGDSRYDPQRTVAFGLWSGGYCGGILFLLYNRLFPRVFPLTLANGLTHPLARRHLVGMVAFDNFVSSPWFFMPSYYVIREALRNLEKGEAWRNTTRPGEVVRTAIATYRGEFWSCMSLTWSSASAGLDPPTPLVAPTPAALLARLALLAHRGFDVSKSCAPQCGSRFIACHSAEWRPSTSGVTSLP